MKMLLFLLLLGIVGPHCTSAQRTAVFLWIKNISHRKPREIKMKLKMLLFLLLLGIVGPHCTSARTHSLKYFRTGSSGVPNFPEFVVVGLVDEVVMTHYDSNTRREGPKQDWMNKITAEDPQYWEGQTQASLGAQQVFKVDMETAKQRFNQTGGVHIFQQMYGCDWDDETGEVKGYNQFGFDGEDFLILDLETASWIAPTREAFLTKQKWDKDKGLMPELKNYFTKICPEYLKNYVNLGRSFLMRTEIPSVSLLQKSPSSPVSCHATGFYPDRALMFWTRDGEELHDNVDHGEILPNHDGSFQMSVDLDVSSFPAEHWDKYRCVFQLSGVKDHVIVLDSAVIRTNRGNPLLLFIIGAVVAALALLIAGIGFLVYRKRNDKKNPPSPASSSELTERLNQPSQ
ncbi:major histocompatibility complex class I-related gene protein-like isoform X1 [Trematomus bernacchii]|uniref:major histocompatibility complex class I-related gene protein-like isoform X1 n=1 Tax=Trematomus bernacchii TaxID=40690 RepID=UPI001469D552|nr:major histocompatibility complex class I-related gene protein-like isoform X1 [Trematomus bernacchii]